MLRAALEDAVELVTLGSLLFLIGLLARLPGL
jgi:hypothetical protein